jgi:hypothetical protein
MQPSLTRRDLQTATTPEVLARGRELAASVEDLDWDEYSIRGGLPGEGIDAGNLMIHHSDLPLCGECPCPHDKGNGLCAHLAAVGWAFLGDDQELADQLATLSHAELVALVTTLADNIPRARDSVWSRLSS